MTACRKVHEGTGPWPGIRRGDRQNPYLPPRSKLPARASARNSTALACFDVQPTRGDRSFCPPHAQSPENKLPKANWNKLPPSLPNPRIQPLFHRYKLPSPSRSPLSTLLSPLFSSLPIDNHQPAMLYCPWSANACSRRDILTFLETSPNKLNPAIPERGTRPL